MLIKIYPENPSEKQIRIVVKCLAEGGIVIFPTDTLYAIGCDLRKPKTAERLAELKGLKLEKANFSIICSDLSHLSDFTAPINNTTFRLMKQCLPGPYTFILDANNNVPRIFQSKRKTVGIRVPNNPITKMIVSELGSPLISTSVRRNHDTDDYFTDPELIKEMYENKVDIIIDGGHGDNTPSTILDCTGNNIEVIRYGKGKID